MRKLFLKTSKYLQEVPVLYSLLKKIAGLKASNFINKRRQHGWFPVDMTKFLRLLFSKNIFERLFFYFFNGSLLHGPKGSRSRLYNGVRLQGLNHRFSFLFLSRHLSSWTESRPAFKNLRRIPLMSHLSFYIGLFIGHFRWF